MSSRASVPSSFFAHSRPVWRRPSTSCSSSVVAFCERQRLLQLDSLFAGQAEVARQRGVDSCAAPVEHAREVADLSIGDGEDRTVVTDVHGHDGGACRRVVLRRRALGDGAQQGERLDIDADEIDMRDMACREELVDRIAIRGSEQDAGRNRAVVCLLLAHHVIVENCLIHRDRECFVGAEHHGVAELLRIVDPVDVDDTDADTVRADAEPNVPCAEACAR